ncbi:hypothetical protein WJX74_004896 [Apatococcus lobatus]|uniref:BTB domain-containing protein n=1 Tax=Apatococcus lobatus TaxID=904363 RepID=A0AAW1RP84_9CHLO
MFSCLSPDGNDKEDGRYARSRAHRLGEHRPIVPGQQAAHQSAENEASKLQSQFAEQLPRHYSRLAVASRLPVAGSFKALSAWSTWNSSQQAPAAPAQGCWPTGNNQPKPSRRRAASSSPSSASSANSRRATGDTEPSVSPEAAASRPQQYSSPSSSSRSAQDGSSRNPSSHVSSATSANPSPPVQSKPTCTLSRERNVQTLKKAGSSSTRRRLDMDPTPLPVELHRELSMETDGVHPQVLKPSNSLKDTPEVRVDSRLQGNGAASGQQRFPSKGQSNSSSHPDQPLDPAATSKHVRDAQPQQSLQQVPSLSQPVPYPMQQLPQQMPQQDHGYISHGFPNMGMSSPFQMAANPFCVDEAPLKPLPSALNPVYNAPDGAESKVPLAPATPSNPQMLRQSLLRSESPGGPDQDPAAGQRHASWIASSAEPPIPVSVLDHSLKCSNVFNANDDSNANAGLDAQQLHEKLGRLDQHSRSQALQQGMQTRPPSPTQPARVKSRAGAGNMLRKGSSEKSLTPERLLSRRSTNSGSHQTEQEASPAVLKPSQPQEPLLKESHALGAEKSSHSPHLEHAHALSTGYGEGYVPANDTLDSIVKQNTAGINPDVASAAQSMRLLDSPFGAAGSPRINLPHADCILKASDGTEFPATRSTLMLESNVIRKLLEQQPDQDGHLLSLPLDTSAADLRLLLEHIYFPHKDLAITSTLHAMHLTELASRFEMPGLKQRCDTVLAREDLRRQYLQLDKAVQAAVFASLHNLPAMLQACQTYLLFNFSQVEKKEFLPMMASSSLAAILLAREAKLKDVLYSAESRRRTAIKLAKSAFEHVTGLWHNAASSVAASAAPLNGTTTSKLIRDMCREVSHEHEQWLGGQEEVSRYPSWVPLPSRAVAQEPHSLYDPPQSCQGIL